MHQKLKAADRFDRYRLYCPKLTWLSDEKGCLNVHSKVMVVDRHPDRLRLAESIGAIAIDDSKVDPVEAVLEQTMGLGADNGCECVGYQAHEPDGQEQANLTMNRLVGSVRFTGTIGVVGVFIPQDPGASDELAKRRPA